MIPNNLFETCQNKCNCWPHGAIHCKGDKRNVWSKLTKEEKSKVDNTVSAMAHHAMTGE